MFNFIHKHAVKVYKDELNKLIDLYSSLDKNQLADYFIYSVWTRAGFQNEGHFKFPNGEKNISPDMSAYPLMLSVFNNVITVLKKKGSTTEAAALSIWVHTLRGLINVDMEGEVKKLWSLIMDTKEFWEIHLNKLYNDDKNFGMDQNLLDATLSLSKKILANVPPEQFR